MSIAAPRQLRAGVIGPSGIGRVHIDCLRRIGVEVRALAASTPDRSMALAEELRVPVACRDADELVRRPDIDVVHICTPNYLHAEQAMAAVKAGKHVVCEKPLATSSADAERLLEVARQQQVVHAVVYNYRFYPMIQAMRARVKTGALGRIHLVQGSYLLDEVLLIDESTNWMLDPGRIGPALALADVGVHWWDLVEHVTGQPAREVLCTSQAARDPSARGEDSAAVLMRLDGGAVAVGAISNAAPGHGNTITVEVVGTTASTWWSQEDPDRMWFARLGLPVEMTLRPARPEGVALPPTLQMHAGQPHGYLDAFRDFMAAIYMAVNGQENGPAFPTFADGLRGVRILEAVIESNARNGWVSVG